MGFQVSPGVAVSEVDLTNIIPAVSTTEVALAGHFRWGPVWTRTLIGDESELVLNYNKPNSNTADDFFTGANFLGYGNKLWVSRVVATGNSSISTSARNAHSASANTVNTYVLNEDDYENNHSTGISGIGDWVAKYPGELGNSLKVSVCPSNTAWSKTLTGNVSITSNGTALAGKGTAFDTETVVGDILILGPDREQVKVLNVGSANGITLAARYSGNSIPQDNVAGRSNACERRWEYYNEFDAGPGTSDHANTQSGTHDEMHVIVVDEDGQWTDAKDTVLDRFPKVSQASDAKNADGSTNYYKNVVNQGSKYVWWAAHNTNQANAGKVMLAKSFAGASTPQTVSLVNGRDGNTPTNANYITGYDKFNNPEEVDVSIIVGAAAGQTRALHLINNIAEVRKDLVACISVEEGDVVNNSGYTGKEMTDSIAFRDQLPSSSYGVLDGNWKWQYDKYNDINRWVPCNGDVAGLMVRTDETRDPWWSPGGFNRGQIKNVLKLAYSPTQGQRDQLYKKGINPIITKPGHGTILFGDKTMLAKPSAFDRINVRRLFIVLEKAIATAANFTLFEFNDEFTRAQFKNMVEPFLRDVQGRRGITDFTVVCDETNNTGEIIDQNKFVGDIYVKPNRSINFIQLNFVAVRTGVEFSEVVGQFG
jgi:phage tail sheath protein FI